MQTHIIELLAAAAVALAAGSLGAYWLRLRRSVDERGAITVVNKHTGRTATLPRDYSPAAVEELLQLLA